MLTVIKKLVVAGLGSTDILEADMPAKSVKDLEVTTLADTEVQHMAFPIADNAAREFLIGYTGTLLAVGSAVTVIYTVTDTNNAAPTVSSLPGYVQSAEPEKITVDGNRRMVQRVKIQPYGAGSSLIPSTTTTTTTAG